VIVVGSGPAGIACAQALAKRGHEVTILDVGHGPDETVSRKYAPLADSDPDEWDPGLVEELRSEFRVGRDELPPKPVLGSLHPYAPTDPSAPGPYSGVGLTPSLGRGGLSAVWGAAMLPYRSSDLTGWPLDENALAPFYRSVLEFVPLAGRRDGLEAEFPLYLEDDPHDLKPTPQVGSLLADLERRSERLERHAIVAGRARIAVRVEDDSTGRACRYTGLCLHGCPLGAIWSADQTLARLVSGGKVRYLSGSYVDRFEERADGVTVTFKTPQGVEKLSAKRLFVGAGVLPTTRLVLRSLDAVGEPVELRDSQYYTFPLLRGSGSRLELEKPGNTLAQAFLELNEPRDPRRSSHMQVYAYSDLMLREVASALRLPPPVVARIARGALSRLFFCQGYLHSDLSRGIRAELTGSASDSSLRLEAVGAPGPVQRDVEAAIGRLRGAARDLGAVPLRRLLRVWEPGRGIHAGGSFPMSARPSGLQTDLLGRPAGLRRTHLIDSSVFPTVPPTTITYTVMANAQRVAAGLADG
jgi:choline dehydrogenase-like flavoprotein